MNLNFASCRKEGVSYDDMVLVRKYCSQALCGNLRRAATVPVELEIKLRRCIPDLENMIAEFTEMQTREVKKLLSDKWSEMDQKRINGNVSCFTVNSIGSNLVCILPSQHVYKGNCRGVNAAFIYACVNPHASLKSFFNSLKLLSQKNEFSIGGKQFTADENQGAILGAINEARKQYRDWVKQQPDSGPDNAGELYDEFFEKRPDIAQYLELHPLAEMIYQEVSNTEIGEAGFSTSSNKTVIEYSEFMAPISLMRATYQGISPLSATRMWSMSCDQAELQNLLVDLDDGVYELSTGNHALGLALIANHTVCCDVNLPVWMKVSDRNNIASELLEQLGAVEGKILLAFRKVFATCWFRCMSPEHFMEGVGKPLAEINSLIANEDKKLEKLTRALHDPFANNARGVTELLIAVSCADDKRVRALCIQGADVNKETDYGATPLMMAIGDGGNREIAKRLIMYGADIDRATRMGTALIQAAQYGDMESVTFLLNNNASVNKARAGCDWYTPLASAVMNGRFNVAEVLLNHGADITVTTKAGASLLQMAVDAGHREMVMKLLDYKADIRHLTNKRDSVLGLAAQKGHGDIVQVLLAHGSDVNHANEQGVTPLMMAAAAGHKSIIELLGGVFVNSGLTILIWQEFSGHFFTLPWQVPVHT
ncbi:hypothetical protein GCM10023116_13650 [Kistimonas scapharcae]|uniref:Ankyrin n=1 Tax=Kistimonas scapharcae TaxID=1036133 RepID=A0ABP8UZI8_9GAMM